MAKRTLKLTSAVNLMKLIFFVAEKEAKQQPSFTSLVSYLS
jgi:hypothetical protein